MEVPPRYLQGFRRFKIQENKYMFMQDICDMGNKCEQMLDLRFYVNCVL